MKEVTISDAARSFMALLKAVESGEEVVITRAGKPVAKLVGVTGAKTKDAAEPAKPRLRSIGFRSHS